MIIIGAGLAGLLAANMLRRHTPLVTEKQPILPNNHTAVLRFRSRIVADTLGIPFREVNLIKGTLQWSNSVADALAYSYKNTGMSRSDRSISSEVIEEKRYIAPADFILQMAQQVHIVYSSDWKHESDIRPVISTMPMPVLMKMLNYPRGVHHLFRYVEGVNIRATIKNCDAYVSLLVPNPHMPFSRISITGDELILELPNYHLNSIGETGIVAMACNQLGINIHDRVTDIRAYKQQYFKILPVPEGVRKEFMHWATINHNIYSLGRYATWRPALLMDDLVKDIRLIEKWSMDGNKYEVAKYANR